MLQSGQNFSSRVVVAFQITFCVKIHANNVFFIFLNFFLTLAHQNEPKYIKYIKF